MAETNVLFEDLLAQVRASREDVTTIHWAGYDIEVKNFISREDAYGMVNNASQGCLTDEGVYLPVYRYCSYGIALIQFYTDIVIGDDYDISDLYELVITTDIIPAIEACINNEQLSDIKEAIREALEIQNEFNLKDLSNKLSGLDNSLDEMNGVISKYTSDETMNSYKNLLESGIFNYDVFKNAMKDNGDINGDS